MPQGDGPSGEKPSEASARLLADMQHWTWVAGRAQQMLLEYGARAMLDGRGDDMTLAMMRIFQSQAESLLSEWEEGEGDENAPTLIEKQADMWGKALDIWQGFMVGSMQALSNADNVAPSPKDPRFKHDLWETHPAYRLMRQIYLAMSEQLVALSDRVDGLDVEEKRKLRFACQSIVDASSPSNFLFTNPAVMERAIETRGQSLLTGLEQMLSDLERGQLTQTEEGAFKLGENIAVTPGKVVHETPMYQLIQYSPTTETVLDVPLVIFPPWINRFYILDLNAKKSFVRWAVEQGITVFMVSWKSADADMKDVVWDDYVRAQIDAIDPSSIKEAEAPSLHEAQKIIDELSQAHQQTAVLELLNGGAVLKTNNPKDYYRVLRDLGSDKEFYESIGDSLEVTDVQVKGRWLGITVRDSKIINRSEPVESPTPMDTLTTQLFLWENQKWIPFIGAKLLKELNGGMKWVNRRFISSVSKVIGDEEAKHFTAFKDALLDADQQAPVERE